MTPKIDSIFGKANPNNSVDVFTGGAPVMALSLNEPFGSLVVFNWKKETRGRNTNVRSWVLLCTCKLPYRDAVVRSIAGMEQYYRILDDCPPSKYLTGAAIGIGYLKDSRPMLPTDERDCYVKYRPELFVWEFDCICPIVPVPWTGKQGWKKVDPDFIRTLKLMRPQFPKN